MSKEETLPVNLYLKVHSIEVNVKKKITLQLGLYRNSKLTPGQTRKFEGPASTLKIDQKLAFNTTIQYNDGVCQKKLLTLKLVCSIDGLKHDLEHPFDIAEQVRENKKNQILMLSKSPQIKIVYSFESQLGDEEKLKRDNVRTIVRQKSKDVGEIATKKISFNVENSNTEAICGDEKENQENIKQQRNRSKNSFRSGQKLKKKISENELSVQQHQTSHTHGVIKGEKSSALRSKSLRKYSYKANQDDLQSKEVGKNQYEVRIQALKDQNKCLHADRDQLLKQNAKLKQQIDILGLDISTYKTGYGQLESKFTALNQELQKVKRAKRSLENEEETKKMILQEKRTQKEMHQEKIKNLQSQLNQIKKKNTQLKQLTNKRQQQTQQIRKQLDFLNLKNQMLSQNLADYEEKYDKANNQIQQLQEKITHLNKQISKELSKKTFIDRENPNISNGSNGTSNKNPQLETRFKLQQQLQKQIYEKEKLQQQLTQKEKLIKVITQCKNQAEKEKAQQVEMLRNQMQALRTQLREKQSDGKNKNSGVDSLEYRVTMEKNKKEIQTLKKNERALIIEKAHIDSRNKQLQEQVIRVKGVVASLLNAVHQNTDPQTATVITGCIE